MPNANSLVSPVTETSNLQHGKRGRQASTMLGYALAIAKTLNHYGVDPEPIFKAVGIPESIGNDPMSRLSVGVMTDLFRVCVEATQDPYFGLTLARFVHISNLHALGFAMAASSTLMDFCKRLARYFHLFSQTADFVLEEAGDEVILRGTLLTEVCGESEDAFMSFLVLAMRRLHRAEFNPVRVELHRTMPKDGSQPYEQLFRSPVIFSVERPALVLARADLLQPLAGACPELAQHHDNIAIDYLTRLDKNDVIARVRQQIVAYLPTGECTRERVAESMCMSPTALHGKLLQRDTNFHALLEETRKELACSYVKQPLRSFTEIAFLLGFSESSNFTRAFKRWTGSSPSEFRLRG